MSDMIIDGIHYDYCHKGCYARQMFQIIEIEDPWDQTDIATWPTPAPYHDLDAEENWNRGL